MKKFLLLSALFSSTVFADPIEEGKTYSYPFLYDDSDFEEDEAPPQKKESKKKSPPAWEGKVGNVDMSFDVKEPDFFEECESEWKKTDKDRETDERRSKYRSHAGKERAGSWEWKGSFKW